MKKPLFFMIISLFVSLASNAFATPVTFDFNPPDHDMYDLEHGYAYKWKLNGSQIKNELNTGASILSASLTFADIRNWDNSSNVLFINLLDGGGNNSITRITDNQSIESNYFNGAISSGYATYLGKYEDLPTTAQNLHFEFRSDALATLTAYILNDGKFGIGLDPDCHFWNNGVSLQVTTGASPVPEPATLFLLGSGLVAFAGLTRRRSNK